ncbi:MAG TPA: acyl-CoA dehydrogenase family protein [Rhizomicrobium sp.]|jgi:alkylation response protein AidB-like acyl-CoA dehydrogenase|nr:acyl-CoA dehydrogenase family protein [Rhizomicrobium sp.]
MDFSFTAEEQAFRAKVRAFAESEWGPPSANGGRDAPDLAREAAFRRRCAEAGYVTFGWPKEFGGRSAGPMEHYILSQEMNRVGAPFPLYIANVLGPLLIAHGNEKLKAELLPRIAAGNINFVLGFSEPSAGSDLANMQTRAERVPGGYRIYGQKLYGLPYDDELISLAVRTDRDAPLRRGISIFLVDAKGEGFQALTQRTMTHLPVGSTFYDGLFVPEHRLLGQEGQGWDLIRETMDRDRFGGIAYAHFRILLERLAAWAKENPKNGEPYAKRPWVRERIGQLAVEVEGTELLQDVAAWKLASGMDMHVEASIIKTFCTEVERRLCEFGDELMGLDSALTFDAGVDNTIGAVNFLYRQNVSITIAGGSNEIQRNIIATQGLGLPREPRAK